MDLKKKKISVAIDKKQIAPLKEEKKEVLSFEQFYSLRQSELKPNEPRHPDWYMIGASPDQYPNSNSKLESPVQAYQKYKKENQK